jgi:hypothetical protein
MPRQSANGLATPVLPWAKIERPGPPESMPEPAAAIWRQIVSSMRPKWFTPETHDLLSRYCGAMAEAARLETALTRVGMGLPSYDRLAVRYDQMCKLALAYARALRITPRANKETKTDGRDPRRSNWPKPWEWEPDDDRPPKKKL